MQYQILDLFNVGSDIIFGLDSSLNDRLVQIALCLDSDRSSGVSFILYFG